MNNVTREVYAMNDVPEDRAKCGQCERDVGAIFCCSERLLGHCPFVEKWSGKVFIKPTWWIFVVAGVLAIGGFFGKSVWAGWATLALLVITSVLFEITRETRLYNAQTYVRLQRTTVASVEWNYRWSWDVALPRVRFEPTQLLTYPPSISSIASLSGFRVSKAQAVTIVRAAIIELLTKQYIKADIFRSYAVTRVQPWPTVVDNYIVLTEGHTEGSENLGKLEKCILFVVPVFAVQSVSKDSIESLRLYDVVRAVYEQDQLDPPAWLAELVARDAAKRDLGYFYQMWPTKKIEWDPTHLPRLREEEKITQSLADQFAESYPEFSRVLDTQISKAISSRETSGGEG